MLNAFGVSSGNAGDALPSQLIGNADAILNREF
jgi:hypothetical protein